jgi:glycosyltransferase involved in cell wall biosynthesis
LSSPLRIAVLLNPFTLARESGDHAPRLSSELSKLGHEVRVFGGGVAPEGSTSDALTPRRFGPDALLAYDGLSPAAWLGARTARALSVPLVLVESGGRRGEGLLARASLAIGERLWGSYVRRTASALVALDPVASERATTCGFPKDRVILLPHGVDAEAYRPGLASGVIQRHGISGRILLYVGRIERNRGLHVLVQAFARTVGQRDDWSLVLVGEGSARGEIRALVDQLGIAARVHWLGRVRDEDLPGLFSAGTLLAVPALDDSVRGRNIVRAMSSGLPVIASDRAPVRALVEPDASGLLVPPGDLAAWIEALRRASMSPDARRRWGRRAREIALKRLAWPEVARLFESLILAERSRSKPSKDAGVELPSLTGARELEAERA